MDLVTAGTVLTVANKLLGKTAESISQDFANLYEKGRDKIVETASRKINDTEDGMRANLRVARDVFWNGSYTDESICAEYFGGILASSRSIDGKDDSGIYYADIIKSLSSKQLMLHYIIYRCMNQLWVDMPAETQRPNPGMMSELQKYHIWFSTDELGSMGISVERDLIALVNKGLVSDSYEGNIHIFESGAKISFTKAQPCTLGVQLYAVAFNRLKDWATLASLDFGSFPDTPTPKYFAMDLDGLSSQLGIG